MGDDATNEQADDDVAAARSDQLGPGEPRSFGNGRYVVQRRLGAGNFATVYQAFDERLDVSVAVKLLSDRWSWEPEVRGRFVQEARILRSLNDRHVVQIRDIAETDDGRPFIVMDYATEGTLESRLTERAHAGVGATPAELREFAAQLTAALGFLHARRIAHRDIKPSNILITSDDVAPGAAHAHRTVDGLLRPGERLMLGDLGLAKDLRLDSGITVGVGTAGYMSPEQAELGAKIDTRTDIYAASALMALVASGEPPDPLRRFTQGALMSGRPLPDRITGSFRSALEQGLDEDPDHRPQTIEAWQAAVDAGLALQGGFPVPSTPKVPVPVPVPVPEPLDLPAAGGAAARSRLLAAAVGGLVLLGAAGVWVVTRSDGDKEAGRTTVTSSASPSATLSAATTTAAPATTISPTSTTVTTTAPVVVTAAPTTAAPAPFVLITGPATIPSDTAGRWWEVSWSGVVRGTWELFDSAGPVPLNGDQWVPGDGFQAALPVESYVLRLTGFDGAGNPSVTELSFTAT